MVMETDFDNDGQPDAGRLERLFVCDRRGLVTEMIDRYLSSDGQVLSSTRTLQTYDQHRCITQARIEEDDGADGTIDRVTVTTDTYIHR